MKNIIFRIKSIKFKTKLIISYILLLTISVLVFEVHYYTSSLNFTSELTTKNTYEIIKSKNNILDIKLSKIEENSLALIRNSELFEIFNDINTNKSNVLSMDRKVTRIINDNFSLINYVYGAQIATSYFIFGNNFTMLDGESYVKSKLYRDTVNLNGKMNWEPTYNYLSMFGHDELKEFDFEVQNVFSASRVINSFYIDESLLKVLDDSVEKPILTIYFKEDFIDEIFRDSIPIKGAKYYIIDSRGKIVSDNDRELIGSTYEPDWLDEVFARKTGTMNINNTLICFDQSTVTDWMTVAEIPTAEIASTFVPSIVYSIITLSTIFIITAIVLSLVISAMITRPINRLTKAMKNMAKGDFRSIVPIDSADEFGYLVLKFNEMREQIENLIEENYAVKIREKETQIMALNLQLNPHFLYNTLNIINWMAIKEGNDKISDIIMNLCHMLVYTVKNKQDMVNFKDDLHWLECYVFIMSARYTDKFSVEYNIAEELNLTKVPKLFLQPFVENAIIHGFEDIVQGGKIKIEGLAKNGISYFRVIDNGKGMSTDTVSYTGQRTSDSIGISNVDQRIKLLFGSEYGVNITSVIGSGTQVEITLPLI
ncbi:cache domain-containing sensor histidine kinase [Ruminiclostridium cellobioparum]|uniref:Integral membrane sensor signal transduction histidine kinase n=1 Tax=Ruminiclostridium cellobioparum subsp. termitidis CT1112 TaxID=1195236 RepID=S0FM14_RUMCE|nr:sensor histidine kinase [Ruminiclostridium cellobioparum]EMS70209.1 integral membrane sensor signal transduction histidine kinase [Ruminiclostridium cellobioparum subsp. termitidis CT1112]